MQYLLDLYKDDEEGIKRVLTGIQSQFDVLPLQLSTYQSCNDLRGVADLCHTMRISSMMIDSYDIQMKFYQLEADILDNRLTTEELIKRIQEIQTLLPDVIESIHLYLDFYD
ncbi:hypothetical protein [Spirosoma endbachense]|uniref:hypothetical protein n=1 Tax=Spirosoma endbachense TaxID=2666025 RepID=UPI001390CAE8|nr:hypothetical protein [Spirosoma endbachense]